MKTLTYLALLCLLMSCGKKSDSADKTIVVTTSNINNVTTYSLKTTEVKTGSVLINVVNVAGNNRYTFTAKSGDKFTTDYSFITQQRQYGQGNLDFTCNGTTLLHINGGSGTNNIITVP